MRARSRAARRSRSSERRARVHQGRQHVGHRSRATRRGTRATRGSPSTITPVARGKVRAAPRRCVGEQPERGRLRRDRHEMPRCCAKFRRISTGIAVQRAGPERLAVRQDRREAVHHARRVRVRSPARVPAGWRPIARRAGRRTGPRRRPAAPRAEGKVAISPAAWSMTASRPDTRTTNCRAPIAIAPAPDRPPSARA